MHMVVHSGWRASNRRALPIDTLPLILVTKDDRWSWTQLGLNPTERSTIDQKLLKEQQYLFQALTGDRRIIAWGLAFWFCNRHKNNASIFRPVHTLHSFKFEEPGNAQCDFWGGSYPQDSTRNSQPKSWTALSLRCFPTNVHRNHPPIRHILKHQRERYSYYSV